MPGPVPVVPGTEVVKALQRAGFKVVRVSGSHHWCDTQTAVYAAGGPVKCPRQSVGRCDRNRGSLSAVAKRQDHAGAASLLRRVLAAFPSDEDKPVDRAIRRRAEGAIIALELATGVATPNAETRLNHEPPELTE